MIVLCKLLRLWVWHKDADLRAAALCCNVTLGNTLLRRATRASVFLYVACVRECERERVSRGGEGEVENAILSRLAEITLLTPRRVTNVAARWIA